MGLMKPLTIEMMMQQPLVALKVTVEEEMTTKQTDAKEALEA